MITPALLNLRFRHVLRNERPVRGRDGVQRWDFEPEYRLVWTDQARVTHLCEMPPVSLDEQYEPRVFCRKTIDGVNINLVDYHELGATNCPACAREEAIRFRNDRADMARATELAPKPRRLTSYIVQSFLLGGLLFGGLEYFAMFPTTGAKPVVQAAAAPSPVILPVVVDPEPMDEIDDEF